MPNRKRYLNDIFKKYPNNNCFDEVLIKVSVLNAFYSTRLSQASYVLPMAEHIVKNHKEIDSSLGKGRAELVNLIALCRNKYCISFATKYCSFSAKHHNHRRGYPIYDSLAIKSLAYYEEKEEYKSGVFSKNGKKAKGLDNRVKAKNRRDISEFYDVMDGFAKHFELTAFSYKELDKFLWQVGKMYPEELKSEEKISSPLSSLAQKGGGEKEGVKGAWYAFLDFGFDLV